MRIIKANGEAMYCSFSNEVLVTTNNDFYQVVVVDKYVGYTTYIGSTLQRENAIKCADMIKSAHPVGSEVDTREYLEYYESDKYEVVDA